MTQRAVPEVPHLGRKECAERKTQSYTAEDAVMLRRRHFTT